jgi:chromosome segregation ATPase
MHSPGQTTTMSSKHDEFDPTRPALVLLYGTAGKKHRMLDRDVLLIGRARGCDLGLEAPDISSVHCVITRGAAGISVRDCQSRAGTKLNGNAVRESPLHDGDLLQIGPFSFRVHLPAGYLVGPVVPNQSRLHHVEHSRRNLARIALHQRKLLRLEWALKAGGDQGGQQAEQLGKQASALKARVSDYDKRARTLEDAERALSRDREVLEKEQAAFRAQVQQSEGDLAGQLKEVETQIQTRWQQCEERCRLHDHDLQQRAAQVEQKETELQARLTEHELRETQAHAVGQQLEQGRQELQELEGRVAPQLQGQADIERQLEERQQKLEAWAAELHQRGEELQARSAQLSEQQYQVQEQARQQQQHERDLETMVRQLQLREQHLVDQVAPLEQQRAQLADEYQQWTRRWQQLSAKLQAFEQEQKEFAMKKEQRAHNQGAILDCLAQHKVAMAQAEETLHVQRQSLDDLIAIVQETSGAGDEDLPKITKENEELKRRLAALEKQRELAGARGEQPQVEPAELEALRAQLADKEAQLERLRHRPERPPVDNDIASYETELNEFQRQLEADRQKLNREFDQLRMRNGELDEATREMELGMSRERAELARERQKLERLRDEVRAELERFQRDAGVRERLAPVQNLREELNNRRQSPQDETPRLGKEDPVQARLRQLRKSITDG